MPLELDSRQRAMLQEMGVQVWLPESGVTRLQRTPEPAGRRASEPAAPVRQRAAEPIARPDASPARAAQLPAVPRPQPAVPAHAPVPPMGAIPAQGPSSAAAALAGAGSAADGADWGALSEAVQSCQACALCAGRSHATLLAPAWGQTPCDWMLLGDPPDEDEDRAGAPFAGADSGLLANMLRALGLQRANPLPVGNAATVTAATGAAVTSPARRAYVSNVLKCRPAHGALAQAAELAQCSAWLQREIALVQPKIIVSLGRFANQLLLGESPQLAALPLGKLRGTVHRYQGVAVVVSYPPKLLMRNGADKAKAWADLCLAAATVDASR